MRRRSSVTGLSTDMGLLLAFASEPIRRRAATGAPPGSGPRRPAGVRTDPRLARARIVRASVRPEQSGPVATLRLLRLTAGARRTGLVTPPHPAPIELR